MNPITCIQVKLASQDNEPFASNTALAGRGQEIGADFSSHSNFPQRPACNWRQILPRNFLFGQHFLTASWNEVVFVHE